jgi:hypothetical protein
MHAYALHISWHSHKKNFTKILLLKIVRTTHGF